MTVRNIFATFAIVATLTGLISQPRAALAQVSVKVAVSPVSFDFGINPGASATNVIKVSNPSDTELQLEARIENILGADENGKVQLTEKETEFSLSSWVKISPTKFTLKARETRTITYTVTVPQKAEPGGHYGSILVGTVAAENSDVTGSATVQRVGSLLLVRVAGEAKEKGLVTDFYPKNYVGEWEEVKSADNTTTFYIPRKEELDKEARHGYFSNGPIALSLTFKNDGNVHFKPQGFVTIHNMFGKKVAELAVDQRNVFPGVERQMTVIWPTSRLWGGFYRAQLVGVYGQSNQVLSATTTFWAFPAVAAGIIGGLIVLVILFRKRLVKVVKVLIKG